ncbi:type I-C CRISPR-associated protein Cas8c/Csd1 [Exiguobacterium aurantiacum]|uniref:type I-C CRISPR-associated protein Cas8c/Csd1 n=1 Tax=Exiguobacterium aurantiacum TaxID=33987 RepID=UPI0008776947|nr:type I-C CRISPR-associated protein Cas8c/Csd1 [Exiguobacterium aurantiacum]
MSVWQQLYETYNQHLDEVGKPESRWEGKTFTLLPISHTTQTAHITVNITPSGEFHSAEVIEKGNGNTLIPSTEDSSSRAGSVVAPYPLHDKLPYVAGDYEAFGGVYKKDNAHLVYIDNLKKWSESSYGFDRLKSIYSYLQKGRLIEDLVDEKVLFAETDGTLKWTWKEKEEKPLIYSVVTGGLEGAFIRFHVHSSEQLNQDPWRDPEFYQSFIDYYAEQAGESTLCFVTGQQKVGSTKHANKIRNAGDKAKLISANDSSGFTFRGRFDKSSEAASISYEVSQKAHNALKWLIQRQGRMIDQRVFLVWGSQATEMPSAVDSTFSLAALFDDVEEKEVFDTNQGGARAFSDALIGYKRKLPRQTVNILILDAATTGRLAILYYRSFDQEHYFSRLEAWHTEHPWEYTYFDSEKKRRVFIGAPALNDIATMAYGPRANEKLIKATVERLIPCVVDGRGVPDDIRRSLTQRASNPIGMENWEWEKTLQIACGMINKKEGMNMALNQDMTDRDYLFGRLLALADYLERRALGNEKRATNAIRYMNAFSQNPARTWMTIQSALQPYQAKLGTKLTYINRLIDEVGAQIDPSDFTNKPLSGKYLLGFYSQRHDLYQKREETQTSKEESVEA